MIEDKIKKIYTVEFETVEKCGQIAADGQHQRTQRSPKTLFDHFYRFLSKLQNTKKRLPIE